MKRNKGGSMRGEKGVTLLEVMVVVTIVGILAAVAIPACNDYVTRSRRSDAFTALETVRAAQEMYRAERGLYSGDFYAPTDGNVFQGRSSGMAGSNYDLSIARTNNTNYTVTADSQDKQTGDFDFRIDQDGDQEYRPDGGGAGSWTDDPKWEDLR